MDSSMNHFNLNQLHVAQQSRREKLRSQHCSPSTNGPQIDDYSSNLDVGQTGFNSGLVQVGDSNMRTNANNIMYHHHHPVGCSSEILEYSSVNQASGAMTSINMIHPSPNGSLKTIVESNLESCGVWKNVSDNNSSEDTIGRYRKKNFLSMVSDLSAFEMKANHQQNQSQYGEMNNFTTQPYYQNALSDGVTTAVIGLQPNCNGRGSACLSWGSYGGGDNEQVPIVPYGYQSDGGCFLSGTNWNADMNLLHARSNQMVVDSHSQGLSLSLCSYPAGSMITESQYVNPQSQHIPQSIPLHNVATVAFLDSKPCNASNFTRTTGTALGPTTNYHRQTGPLGPFTGYATILKCSKFLQPAQQLLDEYCGVVGKIAGSGIRTASDIDLDESGDLATAVNSIVSDVVIAGGITGSSAPTQQDSDEINKGAKNSPSDSYRPDYQAKKAKLLYMLEEVSRRYKQYYQQMRMVVSAFESVAGLAGATPYISIALKAVSSHFNHLNNAISDQLRQIKSFLVEDFSLPNSRIRDKGDLNSKRLKYNDHSFQKHNCSGSSMGLLEPQQHIWRPQRGLPERAVSVLRAWLFEHFLHPYPTDTDKHMLATQTGLTRSQVSNWFINARVRLWKPMVEEVHMLETKGVMERNTNQVEAQDVSSSTHAVANNVHDLKADHSLNKAIGMSMGSVNLECPATSSIYETVGDDQEKHVQVDSHEMTTMNEGMLGNSRYYQHVHDIHGTTTGSISLTLGLRQSADQLNRLEHQPYLQHQDSIRQHLGGHATHEYGG